MTCLEKPWLKSYALGPYKLDRTLVPYPEVSLFQALDRTAAKHPGQTAIIFQGRSLKYRDFKSQVDRLAASLAGLGLGKGDRVCLFLPNCVEFVLCYWAILKAGGVVVPTSILRTQEGLLHEAGTAGCRLIVCREENLDFVLAVKERCQVEHIIVTSTAGYDLEVVSKSMPESACELRTLLDGQESRPPQIEINPREDLCELAFTGGATGAPKAVMLTHYNRHSVILQGLPWLMKPLMRGIAGKASVLISIPMFHTYGNFVHQSAVYLGLRMIILPDPRDTQMQVASIREHRPFLIPGVPTQFMRLADAGLKRVNAMLFSGSAPLPHEVGRMIRQETGMPISEGYGLTETCGVTHINLSAFSRITGFMVKETQGIGVPCPDTECRLIDPETNLDVRAGEVGELTVRGPQVMRGYWPTPGAGLTPDGWLHTGDVAAMGEDGYFQIVDRIKDMVNVSGMKVYTTEVDQVLFSHPAVLMASAFGVPDPTIPGSERVMAVVRLKNERKGTVTERELLDFCKSKLPPYAVPRYMEIREDLPLTVTEKVFRKALRDEAVARIKSRGRIRE
jgi:long-chain acyl-CoA synthetase